jgi:hypothetical protein
MATAVPTTTVGVITAVAAVVATAVAVAPAAVAAIVVAAIVVAAIVVAAIVVAAIVVAAAVVTVVVADAVVVVRWPRLVVRTVVRTAAGMRLGVGRGRRGRRGTGPRRVLAVVLVRRVVPPVVRPPVVVAAAVARIVARVVIVPVLRPCRSRRRRGWLGRRNGAGRNGVRGRDCGRARWRRRGRQQLWERNGGQHGGGVGSQLRERGHLCRIHELVVGTGVGDRPGCAHVPDGIVAGLACRTYVAVGQAGDVLGGQQHRRGDARSGDAGNGGGREERGRGNGPLRPTAVRAALRLGRRARLAADERFGADAAAPFAGRTTGSARCRVGTFSSHGAHSRGAKPPGQPTAKARTGYSCRWNLTHNAH